MKRRVLLVGLVVVVTIAVAVGFGAVRCRDSVALNDRVGEVFEIEPTESYWRISWRLAERGFIDHPAYLWAYTVLHPKLFKLRAGEYRVEPNERLIDFVRAVHEGRVWLHPVTLVEGWTVKAIRRYLNGCAFLDNDLSEVDDRDLLRVLNLPLDRAVPNTEGLWAAETFKVAKHTRQSSILKQAFALQRKRLEDVWAQRDPSVSLANPYEALILASLIERETAAADERPLIASVFYNRLAVHMRLQTDPTVIYALDDRYDGHLHHDDLSVDSPYNTYQHEGLPPGPIGLVGMASLQAALHPAHTGYVYFVASGLADGRHQFSTTLSEHNQAVKQFKARKESL